MKKIVFLLLAVAIVSQPADAQFLKKLFKKKAKSERKASTKNDGIDDALQLPLADITAQADNNNNRNAFLGIPLGIKADRFEKALLKQGFTERRPDGPQTAKSYIYEGDVYGLHSLVTLAVSDQTARVYAVDVVDETVYPSAKAVAEPFARLKQQLQDVYGQGFVDNQGEAYTIQTRLGTICLHYEHTMGVTSYSLGFVLDDAKAYAKAYEEMEDKDYETAPRAITNGLAEPCRHTDLVGLGVKLLQDKSLKGVQNLLRSYDYTFGRANAKALTATFSIGDYQVALNALRRKQSLTSFTLTANDDVEAVRKDLTASGFVTNDQKTYRQGNMTALVSQDKQGRVVLTLR